MALGVAVLVSMACGRQATTSSEQASQRPNVLLISIDTLRADHLGSYGYSRDTSPFLDSLAMNSIRFDQAFAPASWTLPSHMSLFTGAYPQTHGVEQDRFALPAALSTLTEIFSAGGWQTQAFISWTYLKASFGFGRGFDDYRELLPPPELQDSATESSIRADEVVDRVSDWIDQRATAMGSPDNDEADPFFLFVHLFDPHMSYQPPLQTARLFDPDLETIEGGSYQELSRYIDGLDQEAETPSPEVVSRATTLYDGEIRFVDDQLRRLFERLETAEMLEDTVVLVTSDHGEELNEHGSMEGHQWTLYDEVLHVPLILRLPQGRRAGLTITSQVQLIDVAPTLLDIAGLPSLPHADGRSLLPLIDRAASGEAASDDEWSEIAFSHIRRFNKKVAVRTPSHKLIYTEDTGENLFGQPIEPGFELYDLLADPGELENVFEPDLPIARSLARTLQQLLASKKSFEASDAPELSETEKARLRSLGYVQ